LTQNKLTLEICVDSLESAVAAERGGAQRIELCSALSEGGITPSAGLLRAVRKRLSIDICVMIRPRGGDFCYSDMEFEQMQEEIGLAREAGASGVVFGVLDRAGRVDAKRTRQLVDCAAPLPVTFHRAFDMTRDLPAALEAIIDSGASRLLSSGGASNVTSGMRMLKKIVKLAGDRIVIMPGSGIRPENIAAIAEATGATEFHTSARVFQPSPMRYRKRSLSLGDLPGREYARYTTSTQAVRSLARALATYAKVHQSANGWSHASKLHVE
jgi:copper homeostasis protein